MEPTSDVIIYQPYACRGQMSKWGAHVRSAVRRRGRTRGVPPIAPPGTSVKAGLPFTFPWKWLAQLAGFAGLYFALARFGNIAGVGAGTVAGRGPAAGLAVAGLWWGGYRLAPAIALGAFVFAWQNGVPAPVGAAAAFTSMLGPIVAVFLMRRYIDAPRLFDRVGDVFLFFLCAAVAPALVDALGVASLCFSGVGKWDDFRGLWLLSWVGDLMGTLIAAPALLVWTWPERLPWTARVRVEAAGGFALLTICSALVFTGKLASIGVGFPFLVLPIVVWIALRSGQRAAVSATLLVCAFADWGTLHGMGPFAESDMPLPVLAVFMGVMAMTGLVLAASVTERKRADEALRRSRARCRHWFVEGGARRHRPQAGRRGAARERGALPHAGGRLAATGMDVPARRALRLPEPAVGALYRHSRGAAARLRLARTDRSG